MKTYLYILIEPLDDSGNDDGIINSKEMTSEEAYKANIRFIERGLTRQWIEEVPKKPSLITHLD